MTKLRVGTLLKASRWKNAGKLFSVSAIFNRFYNSCIGPSYSIQRHPTPSNAIQLLFGLLLASCTNSMKEIDEVTSKAKPGVDRGEDVTILYSKGGHLSARLFSKTFIRAEGGAGAYTEMRDGLKVEFYNDSLVLKNTLTARYARWYEKQNNVLIRDSVLIVTSKGERLETSELVWNQQLNKFFTEKPVRIITPTRVLYGTDMEANQDFSSYTIHNLTGQVQVEKSKMPQ